MEFALQKYGLFVMKRGKVVSLEDQRCLLERELYKVKKMDINTVAFQNTAKSRKKRLVDDFRSEEH